MKKFKEVFGSYFDASQVSPIMGEAFIKRISVNSQLRTIKVDVDFPQLVSRNDIHTTEKHI